MVRSWRFACLLVLVTAALACRRAAATAASVVFDVRRIVVTTPEVSGARLLNKYVVAVLHLNAPDGLFAGGWKLHDGFAEAPTYAREPLYLDGLVSLRCGSRLFTSLSPAADLTAASSAEAAAMPSGGAGDLGTGGASPPLHLLARPLDPVSLTLAEYLNASATATSARPAPHACTGGGYTLLLFLSVDAGGISMRNLRPADLSACSLVLDASLTFGRSGSSVQAEDGSSDGVSPRPLGELPLRPYSPSAASPCELGRPVAGVLPNAGFSDRVHRLAAAIRYYASPAPALPAGVPLAVPATAPIASAPAAAAAAAEAAAAPTLSLIETASSARSAASQPPPPPRPSGGRRRREPAAAAPAAGDAAAAATARAAPAAPAAGAPPPASPRAGGAASSRPAASPRAGGAASARPAASPRERDHFQEALFVADAYDRRDAAAPPRRAARLNLDDPLGKSSARLLVGMGDMVDSVVYPELTPRGHVPHPAALGSDGHAAFVMDVAAGDAGRVEEEDDSENGGAAGGIADDDDDGGAESDLGFDAEDALGADNLPLRREAAAAERAFRRAEAAAASRSGAMARALARQRLRVREHRKAAVMAGRERSVALTFIELNDKMSSLMTAGVRSKQVFAMVTNLITNHLPEQIVQLIVGILRSPLVMIVGQLLGAIMPSLLIPSDGMTPGIPILPGFPMPKLGAVPKCSCGKMGLIELPAAAPLGLRDRCPCDGLPSAQDAQSKVARIALDQLEFSHDRQRLLAERARRAAAAPPAPAALLERASDRDEDASQAGLANAAAARVDSPALLSLVELSAAERAAVGAAEAIGSGLPGAASDSKGGVMGKIEPKVMTAITAAAEGKIMPQVQHMVQNALGNYLKDTVSHTVHRSATRSLSVTLTREITKALTTRLLGLLARGLTRDVTRMTTQRVIPSLTHSLAPVLAQSLTRKGDADWYCYYCTNRGLYCQYCNAERERQYYSDYSTNYYAEFYARYYAAFYGTSVSDHFASKLTH